MTKYLEKATARHVLQKLNKFVRSARFEVLEIDWINDSQDSGLFAEMTDREQNEYLDTLYILSKSNNQSLASRA